MHQQAAEQGCVHPRRHAEKQIGLFRRGGTARIDDDQLRAALALVGDHALIENGMAPGGVRAHQNNEIGLVEIGIGAGHRVGAEGAAMAGNG